MITGRTGKQIRDRFLNKLKPNIKKGDWTQAEDALLVQLYYQIGHKWSKIATYLPGRTEGQVKNRFYSHVKKKILKDIPEGSASPSVDNGSTSPMTKAEQSPSHSNKAIRLEPVQQQNQQVFYQQQQHVQQNIPMTQNNFGNQRNVQFNADPTDVISYENPNFNHQNSNMNPPIANDQHGTSDSFVSYNAPTIQLEKEIDSVLNKYASFFDAPSTQNSHNLNVNFSPESGDTFEKLDRIEQLKQRKKNLEYLLTKTMQEITSGGGPQMNGFH